MVDIVQLVERQIVALEVVGSSPTIHPIYILLGYSQVVRHETLTLASVGSNPATPAIILYPTPSYNIWPISSVGRAHDF